MASTTRVEIRLDPVMDLWMSARPHAAAPEEAPAPLRPLARAMRDLAEKLPGGWGRLEGGIHGAASAAEVAERLGSISTLRTRGGGSLDIAAELAAVLAALEAAEPGHRKELWPERKKALERARADLESTLLPVEGQVFAYLLRSFRMEEPNLTIPVYLVSGAPDPGAKTFFGRGRKGICIVSVAVPEFRGTGLAEAVLHEATHAVDLARDHGVLVDLRERLGEAGLGRRDRAFRDVPHTLMFAQAGETIRRLVDPEHEHYGDGTSTYYERTRDGTEIRDLWIRHLDGELSLEQVLDRLVALAAAAS